MNCIENKVKYTFAACFLLSSKYRSSDAHNFASLSLNKFQNKRYEHLDIVPTTAITSTQITYVIFLNRVDVVKRLNVPSSSKDLVKLHLQHLTFTKRPSEY